MKITTDNKLIVIITIISFVIYVRLKQFIPVQTNNVSDNIFPFLGVLILVSSLTLCILNIKMYFTKNTEEQEVNKNVSN